MGFMKKLIIIPAFNEEENIVETIKNIEKNTTGYDYIIINDCSIDSTLATCLKNSFNVIDLPVNLGIGGAVQTGYLYAYYNDYDCAVQIDGDGQHDSIYLSKMLQTLVDYNYDMVIGSRFIKKEGFQSTLIRRIGIRFFSLFIKLLTGQTITDPTSGFRIVNKKLIKLFANSYPQDYPEPESLVAVLKRGYNVVEVPVIMKERYAGVSSIKIVSSIYYMIKVSIAIFLERLRKDEC